MFSHSDRCARAGTDRSARGWRSASDAVHSGPGSATGTVTLWETAKLTGEPYVLSGDRLRTRSNRGDGPARRGVFEPVGLPLVAVEIEGFHHDPAGVKAFGLCGEDGVALTGGSGFQVVSDARPPAVAGRTGEGVELALQVAEASPVHQVAEPGLGGSERGKAVPVSVRGRVR